jgi:hypothetical protein
MRQFGKEASEIGVESLTQQIGQMAAKYGDDVFIAVRKVGPRALKQYVARQYGPESIKLVAKYGDDAIWIINKPNRMALFLKYGENAAESMIKHRAMADLLIEKFGQPAAGALKMISAQNGRRLVMLAEDEKLARILRQRELFDLINKRGDSAVDFIWKNKGALAATAALTAFVANPDMFISGEVDINKVGGQDTTKSGPVVPTQPVVPIPPVVSEAENQATNWTGVGIVVVVLCVIGLLAALGASARNGSGPASKPGTYPEV